MLSPLSSNTYCITIDTFPILCIATLYLVYVIVYPVLRRTKVQHSYRSTVGYTEVIVEKDTLLPAWPQW